MSQTPSCSIRDFRIDDAAAVHRWFNNREATKTLMEQRVSFSLESAEGWTANAAEQSGEDRKYAIEVPGIEQPIGFTALYGLFSRSTTQTRPIKMDWQQQTLKKLSN